MEENRTWQLSMPYQDRQVENACHEEVLQVSSEETRYTVVKCLLRRRLKKPGQLCRICGQFSAEGADWRLYVNWLDARGQAWAQDYFAFDTPIRSPEAAAFLEIEVLILGNGPFRVSLSELTVRETPCVPRKVRVCSIPYGLAGGEEPKTFRENIEYTAQSIDLAAKHKPDLMVLTECVFHTRVIPGADGSIPYTRRDGPAVAMLREKARTYGSYIVCSIKEQDEAGILHNTGLLINRQGELQGTYYKSHLTSGELEDGIPLSRELPVFETDFGTLGILICWDHFFPEALRALALQGAELVAVPSHGFRRERLRTRAEENGLYMAIARYADSTVIADPNGTVLSESGPGRCAFAEIDLSRKIYQGWLSSDSRGDPHDRYLHERRPEAYGLLTEGRSGR